MARRPRGKIDNICWGGGEGIAFIFRPVGLNRSICPVKIPENMTIKRRMTGFELKRLGDGVAASVLQGMFVEFSAGGGLGTSILRTGGQKQSSRLVLDNKDTKNQKMDERVEAQVARGVCMVGHLDLPFLPCFI